MCIPVSLFDVATSQDAFYLQHLQEGNTTYESFYVTPEGLSPWYPVQRIHSLCILAKVEVPL